MPRDEQVPPQNNLTSWARFTRCVVLFIPLYYHSHWSIPTSLSRKCCYSLSPLPHESSTSRRRPLVPRPPPSPSPRHFGASGVGHVGIGRLLPLPQPHTTTSNLRHCRIEQHPHPWCWTWWDITFLYFIGYDINFGDIWHVPLGHKACVVRTGLLYVFWKMNKSWNFRPSKPI